MGNKYQSAIEKLREKQKTQTTPKTSANNLESSKYSEAFEKLGKFVSAETQKNAQSKISAAAQQPILQRVSAIDKAKNDLANQRKDEQIVTPISPEYSETRKNQQSAEANARQSIQQKLLEQKKQERLAQDIEKAKEEQAAQKTNGNKVIDAINYVNARGADAIANWNDELLLAGDKLLASIKAAVKSAGGYNKPTYQTTPTWTEEKNNAEKAVEKVENIVKDVDKAQTHVLEEWAKEDTAYKRAEATEKQYEDVADVPLVKGAGDTVSAISYMLPTMAANLASGGVLSAPVMAEFGANNAYKEARAEGASINDAKSYALLEGINQGIGDMLIGGLAGTGEGLISKGLNKVTGGKLNSLMSKAMGKLVTSPAGKTAIKYFGNALGEGVEESLQSVVTTLNKNVTFDKDSKVNWGDVAYEGLIGSLMGGVFAASQISSDYQAYKSDADIVNAFAQAVEKIETTDDVSAVRELGEFISQQMEETINDKSADDEVKERAKFIKAGVDSVNETIDRQADEIVKVNNEVSTAVDAIADSPAKDVVKNTARLVDTVSDIIEPDKDAVNATIDVIRDKIIDANEKINTATTEAEKREATIEKAVYTEIDNTLRNNRSNVETARAELEENNLTVEPGDATIKVPEANPNYDITLQHVIQKHTKTGEDLHVVKIPSRIDKAEYNEIKTQIKKIGGYYSSYAKGFIVPAESIDKIADNLAEINVGVNISDANIDNTATDNAQATTGTATLKMPDGLNASDKTKFTRAFKKWAENEYVNITDMSSAKAHMFASFASKLYEAGYNGIKKIGNHANLTDAELTEFPVFLQDVFYSLGSTAAEGKPYSVQDETEKAKLTSAQESTAADNEAQTNADELEKGENIPDSNITLDKDGEDYSDKHQQIIEEYANAVDPELRQFIDEVIDSETPPKKPYILSPVSKNNAEEIKKILGIDAEGWATKLEPRMLEHIWKRHGENGRRDHSMENRDDIARIQYVIDNADSIEAAGTSKGYVYADDQGKNRFAKTIKYSKKVNGIYYLIEAIPDSSKKTAFIVSAFMDKNKEASIADDAAASPTRTAAGNDVNTLSDKQTPTPVSGFSENMQSFSDSGNSKSRRETSGTDKTDSSVAASPISSITQTTENVNTPEAKIADFVTKQLASGTSINSGDLQVVANKAFGGTQAEGAYDAHAMTDAMELGVNKYLLSMVEENIDTFNSDNASNAIDSIYKITDEVLLKLPTQTKRSDEQVSLQQFSTPPNIAYTAAWVANINDSDVALEPSAGIGGLATFAKAFGAETVVNELSERRLSVIKNMPFDAFYNENAEQIDNILPDDVKPTVVIMNPPFSSTGGRTKNSTKNAIPHIEQALLRLEDGGRLVAIVGRGMADDTPTFKNWWNQLREEYNIRANIGISGENYRKYGTTFDVQLVVIDKTGPQTGETITGFYDDLYDIPTILEGVRNDRTRKSETDREVEPNKTVTGSKETGVKAVSGGTRPDSDGSSRGISGRNDTARTAGNMEKSNGDSTRSVGDSSENMVGGYSLQPESDIRVSDNDRGGGRLDRTDDAEVSTEQGSGRMGAGDSGTGNAGLSGGVVQSESVTETPKKRNNKKAAENDDGVYAEYKTAPLTVKGAKKHPAKIVESSAMSAVSSPILTYKPKIDQSLITNGELSDVQLESISYAGQSHNKTLKNGQRRGFFIGDGTGLGKGREIAGMILDNWNQGRKKAIWISEKHDLLTDAKRDWADLGGDPNQMIDWTKAINSKKGLPYEGILFITYDSLKVGPTKKRSDSVVDLVKKWFGEKYDGVIAFDEAHNMGNLIPMKGSRGKKKPSQKAIAGDKLQQVLPNARIAYVSATGATNIENLSYASRLGLWGEGTSFRDTTDFITKIGRSGIAAMELVARDMKAMGVYLARSISYDGVVYDNIQHKLSPVQRKMYDGMSEGWQIVLQNFDKAMQVTNSENAKTVRDRRGQIYTNMQQFYNQVLTSMAMPTVIKDIEKQLASDKSCVIQLVNTNEAAQDRAVSDAKSEGKSDLDDLDITPRQLLVGYVENAFPVNQYEEYIDDNGNVASRVVVDSTGQPVVNRQAVRMKEELIAKLNEISIPEGPLDMLLNHFGADQIAEITGRSGRVLTVVDENGNEHKQYIKRDSKTANIAETKDFQDGKKRILVFSSAGSTGRSFHADKRAKNQQQRIHYVLQPGWEASKAVQGFGRTHRSNQVNTPVFRLVSTDVMGHKRFVTSIARRLDQLGALTKGQRQTGSGVFGEKDNLESPLSRQALREFYRRLGANRLPDLDARSVLGKMGLEKAFYDEFNSFKLNEEIASDITKFLNRILALPVEEQNEVFTAFEEIRDSMYQQALESGELDTGLENVKADKIEITQDDVIYTEPTTGAETRYVKAKLYTKPRIISTVEDAEVYRDRFQGLYRMENGSVRAVYRIADRSDQWGRVFKNYVLISPNTGVQSRYIETTLAAKTQAIPKSEWEAAWAEELAKVPEYNESDKHMITGAILPVWNKLPESDNVKAQRIIAEDGTQYLGRIIQPDRVDSTLRSFDVKAQKDTQNGNTIYDAIYNKNNIVTMRGLYGGTITISKRRVSNENRIEISGSNVQYISERFPGVFSETIQYQRRHFIPTGDKGIKILDDMVKELGVRSVESEDSGGAYYSLGTSRGKWGKGDSKAPVMSINELTKQATRIFGIEINTGKIGNKNASGVFKTHANTIRTRVYGDLPTIAHELGHMFDKKYNLQGNPHIESLVNSFASGLEAAGYTEAQFASESIAEYFSEYMTDREATERKFKAFTEWMYSTISTTDEKKLIDYSGMTNAYFNADLERRADAQIHTRVKDNTAFAQAQMQVDTFLKNPQAYSGNLARKFARWFVDDIVDLKNFGKSYDLAMLEKQADSVTIGRLESAMTDRYGNIVGSSLASILETGSINELNRLAFDKYLIAYAALDRITAAENAKEGESVGSLVYGDERLQNKDSIVERIETYERENPTFHDTAEQIYEYNRNLLQLAVQSGLMSQSLVDALNERYPHYVPLYRVMDDTKNKSPKAKRGYADQKTPIARFKGSGRDIYSPIENIILNTEKFTKACMRNDVMTEFADYIDFNEDMGWAAEKITERKFLDRVSTNDIVEKLMGFSSEKLDSLSEQEAGELITEIIDFVGDYASQWKPAAYQGKNVVSVMRDGKRSYYEVHDADLLKCLTNLNNQQMNFIIKALGGATSAFKVLTTGSNPIFGVTNVQRDVLSGYVSSTTTNNPIAYARDYAVGLYEAIRKTENYKKYLREGGGYSDAVSRDTSRLRKTEAELVKTTNNLKRFAQILGDIVPRLVESGESASRYAEYKRAREQGIEALEAVRLSQEVTVNFARGGTVVKEIDKFIPYFRASINSMYHLVDVLSTGDKKTKAARWAKFVGANTAPAILALVWRTIASAVFGEDEEKVEDSYQTLSAYNKNAYWCYYVGDGQFFRVAKPKDMTVLSTVWERLVEFGLIGEKDALYGLGEYIVDSLCPTTDIMLISTALDLAKNETYTGSPIVPQSYENLAPELQYKDDTSKVSIALGDLLGVSPMKLDYILEDNTGFVGQLITNLLRNDGKMNFGFANKFVVDSVYSTDVANIFYDTKEKYDSNAASYKHTLGKDSRYSIADVYGSYKYGKIASTYSDLNSRLKAEPNKDEQRTLKDKMNAFLDAINNTEMSDLDKAVIDIAEIAGADISDIAPYVVVPDSVTYSNNGYKEKFNLTFDEMLNYYVESQVIMNAYYSAILESGYGEEMMAEAMIAVKKEVSQQLRDRWEAIKFNQKYN